jgi:hypothetical protein
MFIPGLVHPFQEHFRIGAGPERAVIERSRMRLGISLEFGGRADVERAAHEQRFDEQI